MKKLLLILCLFPVLCFAQVTKFMGRYDVNQVDSLSPTTWRLTGEFVDLTGSYTGLDAAINCKIIQRGYDSVGHMVYDRYNIVSIVSQDVTNLVVTVVSDFPIGIQNMYKMPITGIFPIAKGVTDTSKLIYRTSFQLQNLIDPDYDAGLTNLNLKEQKNITTPWKKETSSDGENNWTLSFVLTTSTTILYNGQPLRPSQWTGLGASILNVNLDVRKYDFITILNN